MVVVNLYPFEQTVAKPGCSMDDAIENIDIGGPAMVRAAAKNHAFVAVVTDPADYASLIAKMKSTGGKLGFAERYALAAKAFSHTSEYDGMISNWLTARDAERKARRSRRSTMQCASRRRCATARTRTRRRFYVERDPPRGTLAGFTSCRARSSATTTSPTRRGVGMLPHASTCRRA
jgi:phosphoribosylaminoimidazolecarboxamide formyltransferase/IMP cyclohydrolase